MPHITLNDGQRMYVRVIGRGQPVLMLHGFAMHSMHWLTSILPLSHRYRFFMPDFRGFGRSRALNFEQADVLADLASDTRDVLNWIGDEVALAGISMGACTAMRYNELFAFDGVRRYMHIDQSPRVLNDEQWSGGLFGEHNQALMQSFKEVLTHAAPYREDRTPYDDVPDALRDQFWMLASTFFEAAISERYQKAIARRLMAQDWFRQFMLPLDNWSAYLDCMAAYAEQDYDMRHSIKHITVPLTIAVGMRSHMYPAHGQLWLAENVPHARVVRFERSGHTIPLTEPIKFVRELDTFLSHPH